MTRLRRFCSTVHLWVGLALSVVLIVLSVTGSALVFRHEIDRALAPGLLRVEPGDARVPLAGVVAAVRDAAPESPPRLLRLPRDSESPHEVWLADDRHVYVDPYRGTVLGVRGDREGAMNLLFALHAELLGGEGGARVVGVIGLLTLLLGATGLVLWWPQTVTVSRLKKGLKIPWRHGPWRLNYDLHRAGGFYTSAFLALVAATGAALVFYAETGAALQAATGADPPPSPPAVAASEGPPTLAALDAALGASRQALPDGAPTFVTLPQAGAAPLAVRLRTPGEWHPNGRSYVYLGSADGRLLRVDDARAAPGASRAMYAAYPLHIGAFGGVAQSVVRVLYLVLGLAPAVLSVTGTLIWYRRWRRKRRPSQNGSAPLGRARVRPAAVPPRP